MSKLEQICNNCKYSREYIDPIENFLRLECHRNPPTAGYNPQEVEEFENHRMVFSIWPIVGPNDWCGEWQEESSE